MVVPWGEKVCQSIQRPTKGWVFRVPMEVNAIKKVPKHLSSQAFPKIRFLVICSISEYR